MRSRAESAPRPSDFAITVYDTDLSVSSIRTALVTGATAGVGRALAIELAAAGLTVGIVGRDAARVEAVRAEIAAASGGGSGRTFVGDLARIADVRRLGAEVTDAFPRLDVLVHSAAVFMTRRTVTADGLETMFATNHLAPFLLTNLLLPLLRASAPSRILVLTAPSPVRLEFDDLQGERRFGAMTAFARTKAADLLLVHELARRLAGTGVTANAVHPGLVRTALMRQAAAPVRWALWLVSAPPRRVAKAIVPLALAADYDGRSGRLFKNGREIDAPPYTRDDAVARRLWDVSEELTGQRETQGLSR
jgi:NAD(P)-dependent dehydrogenase (short-subunit alcohol dehydrogenase family)